MNVLVDTLSIVIGINLWLDPQISEHWPKNRPARLIINLVWFNRPGVASILIPREGIPHECKTSAAVTSMRTCVLKGKIVRLSVSINRKFFFNNSFIGIMYESNSKLLKSEYSYLQYHWCPIVLRVIIGLLISSNKYNSRKEGRAIKISVIAGKIVQIISIFCPSSRNRLFNLLKNRLLIKYPTKIVIINKISRVWSWKKDNCSIRGEALSWRLRFDQVAISKESINFIYRA